MAYLIIRKVPDKITDKRKKGYDRFNFILIKVSLNTYKKAKKYNWSFFKSGSIKIIQDKNESNYRPHTGTTFLNFLYGINFRDGRVTVRYLNGNKLDFTKKNLVRLT